MKLSILMPVYNEGAVVERCISPYWPSPCRRDMERELVIVDDCSTDGTWDTLERLAAQFPEIQLYRQPRNRGKGAAVRTAIEKATGDFSLIQDADLEYDPTEYPRLLQAAAGRPRRRGLRIPLHGRGAKPRSAFLALHDQ